jgi:hypothetical protein
MLLNAIGFLALGQLTLGTSELLPRIKQTMLMNDGERFQLGSTADALRFLGDLTGRQT